MQIPENKFIQMRHKKKVQRIYLLFTYLLHAGRVRKAEASRVSGPQLRAARVGAAPVGHY